MVMLSHLKSGVGETVWTPAEDHALKVAKAKDSTDKKTSAAAL